jgi:hypothetical protein
MTFHQAAPAGRPCALPTGMRQGDLGPDEPARMIRNLPNANWLKGKNLSTPPGLSRYTLSVI